MQEDIAALARKYREEMLRLYGGNRRSSPPAEDVRISTSAPANVENPPQEPVPLPEPQESPAPLPEPEPPMEPEFSMEPEEPELPPVEYEEPALPEYIRGTAELPEIVKEEKEEGYTAQGTVQVVAVTGAFPVPGATVTISREHDGKDHLMYVLLTDDSGETPIVTLPAAPAALSQEPGNAHPYAPYNIRIFANGYFRIAAEDVPVFAGVTSRQVFRMIPLPLITNEDMETIVYPNSSMDL